MITVKVTVRAGTRAVVRIDGVAVQVLEPGRHRLPRVGRTGFQVGRREVQRVDVRRQVLVLAGQELATADVPGVRVSVAVLFHVVDPLAFLDVAADPLDVVRLAAQLALRDAVATRELAAVTADRGGIAAELQAALTEPAAEVGVEVRRVELRDVTLPHEVRHAVLALHTARQEGLAALERARGETAALRALANGARVLADNPGLLQLRTAQEVAKAGGVVTLTLTPT
ncbi:slipin family protein [Spongisporangium articulatum]|uniref:Slipin family protein n=1 Tax=Spongisporangium articulatum TaxID=3362603 RepID=A0ABW8AK46_9ACTN